MPAVYCLLTGKSQKLYGVALQLVTAGLGDLNLEMVTCDFELALMNAIHTTLGSHIKITGCLFHYCQALLRWIKHEGLQGEYERMERIYKYVRRFMALPLLPAEAIDSTVDELKKTLPSKLNIFLKYWEAQWGEGGRVPKEKWGVFSNPIRTNNAVEGWHNRIAHQCRRLRLNEWSFIIWAKKEQDNVRTKLIQIAGGNSIAREPSKIQKDKNQKVENLINLYTKGDIDCIPFLDSVSDTLCKVVY